MYCDQCGSEVREGQSFCSSCGKAFASMPMMPSAGRIAGHIRLLGILWIGLSVFRLIPGLILLFVANPNVRILPPEVPDFVPTLLQVIGVSLLGVAGLGIGAGWGLLERRPWARMLAIVLGCLGLIDMPFGTALGIYTLWVLLPAKSEEEYRQMERAD